MWKRSVISVVVALVSLAIAPTERPQILNTNDAKNDGSDAAPASAGISDDAEAHNNLGLALVRNGEFDAAIVEFRKALALNPDFAEAHNNLGYALAWQR